MPLAKLRFEKEREKGKKESGGKRRKGGKKCRKK